MLRKRAETAAAEKAATEKKAAADKAATQTQATVSAGSGEEGGMAAAWKKPQVGPGNRDNRVIPQPGRQSAGAQRRSDAAHDEAALEAALEAELAAVDEEDEEGYSFVRMPSSKPSSTTRVAGKDRGKVTLSFGKEVAGTSSENVVGGVGAINETGVGSLLTDGADASVGVVTVVDDVAEHGKTRLGLAGKKEFGAGSGYD